MARDGAVPPILSALEKSVTNEERVELLNKLTQCKSSEQEMALHDILVVLSPLMRSKDIGPPLMKAFLKVLSGLPLTVNDTQKHSIGKILLKWKKNAEFNSGVTELLQKARKNSSPDQLQRAREENAARTKKRQRDDVSGQPPKKKSRPTISTSGLSEGAAIPSPRDFPSKKKVAKKVRAPAKTPSKNLSSPSASALPPVSAGRTQFRPALRDGEVHPMARPTQISKKTNKPKKRVGWPDDEALTTVKIFIKEDMGFTKSTSMNFLSARERETRMENEKTKQRMAVEEELAQKRAAMVPAPTARWLVQVIEFDEELEQDRPKRGSASTEVAKQEERERSIIAMPNYDESPTEPAEAGVVEDEGNIKVIPSSDEQQQPSDQESIAQRLVDVVSGKKQLPQELLDVLENFGFKRADGGTLDSAAVAELLQQAVGGAGSQVVAPVPTVLPKAPVVAEALAHHGAAPFPQPPGPLYPTNITPAYVPGPILPPTIRAQTIPVHTTSEEGNGDKRTDRGGGSRRNWDRSADRDSRGRGDRDDRGDRDRDHGGDRDRDHGGDRDRDDRGDRDRDHGGDRDRDRDRGDRGGRDDRERGDRGTRDRGNHGYGGGGRRHVRPCKFFNSGGCNRGSACTFSHNKDDGRR